MALMMMMMLWLGDENWGRRVVVEAHDDEEIVFRIIGLM